MNRSATVVPRTGRDTASAREPEAVLEDRPAAGPRRPREIWTGRSGLWLSEVSADPSQPMRNVEGRGFRGANKLVPEVLERDRRRRTGRIVGIDAARGFALVGMFAVHILDPLVASGERATVVWTLLAGNASALFAVLAGVSLAFSSGGEIAHTARAITEVRVRTAVRALLLLAVGMALNMLGLPVFNILVYFGAMFLLVLPFIGMRAKALVPLGAALLIVLPFLRYLIHAQIDTFGYVPNPTFLDVANDPLGVALSLVITGVYPALTWSAFLILGIGIGRLPLQNSSPRIALAAVGSFTLLVASLVSTAIVTSMGGYRLVQKALPGSDEDAVDDFLVFGPEGPLPTGSPGWLLSNGPHTDTPFAMLTGAGFALAAIGVFVILSRWQALFTPLIDMGAMSFTIYVLHLVIMRMAPDAVDTTLLFFVQVLAAAGFACLWRLFSQRGPIEIAMAVVAGRITRLIVGAPTQDRAGRGR